jgi:hypothetical protein
VSGVERLSLGRVVVRRVIARSRLDPGVDALTVIPRRAGGLVARTAPLPAAEADGDENDEEKQK